MLRNLRLCGYRGFTDYRLLNLSRVNLLVGRNNSGKTSILEAIQFLVSQGDPLVLVQAARRRGETNSSDESEGRSRFRPDLSHVFPGHQLSSGTSFRIHPNRANPTVTATVVELDPQQMLALEGHSDDDFLAPSLGLEVRCGEEPSEPVPLPFWMTAPYPSTATSSGDASAAPSRTPLLCVCLLSTRRRRAPSAQCGTKLSEMAWSPMSKRLCESSSQISSPSISCLVEIPTPHPRRACCWASRTWTNAYPSAVSATECGVSWSFPFPLSIRPTVSS